MRHEQPRRQWSGGTGGLAGGRSAGLGLSLAGEQHLTSHRPWANATLVAGPHRLQKPLRTAIDGTGQARGSLPAPTDAPLGPAATISAAVPAALMSSSSEWRGPEIVTGQEGTVRGPSTPGVTSVPTRCSALSCLVG